MVVQLWKRIRRRGCTSAAVVVCVTGLIVLLAGCDQQPTADVHPPLPPLPVLTQPAMLVPYHILVTDLLTGDVAEIGRHTTHVAKSVHGLGLSPDGHTLFVTDIADDAVVSYPILPGAKLGTPSRVHVGNSPVHMVETLDGRTLYVSNFGEASVSVVDVARWQVTSTITVPASPHGIIISPDGRWVYVACVRGGAIAVIDTASQTLAGTIALPIGAQPYGVALSRDGRTLYAADNFAARLFVIDVATRRVTGDVAIGLRSALIARSPDGSTLYVTNGASGTVSVVDIGADPTHPVVRATVRVGTYPHGLAVTPDGHFVVVANTLGDTLSVIETTSEQVVATIPGERFPNDVLALP